MKGNLKNMKKFLILLVIIFSTIIAFPVTAKEKEEKELSFDKIFASQIIELETINRGDYYFDLFVEFINNEIALNTINQKDLKIINNINKEYDLGKISEDNWEIYYSLVRSYFDLFKEEIDVDYAEYLLLVKFFDIFENKYVNEQINKVLSKETLGELELEQLYYLLPYDNEFVKQHQGVFSVDSSRVALNLTEEINYANSYAILPAPIGLYYYFRNGDCANFTSQILYAGGQPQVVTNSVYTGWWHKMVVGGTPSHPTFTHTHSRSWTFADDFIRYFGTLGTYTSHFSFSQNIVKGSYIGLDSNNDGNWNHVGFVMDKASYSSSLGYYDYLVAQHTTNYKKWTSSSGNHWEDYNKWCKLIR